MTPDGNHLCIPNALVFRSVMLNYTRNSSRWFEFDVGFGVHEDLLAAHGIGTDAMRIIDGVMGKPPARAYISALDDSTVRVSFHAWADQRSHDFAMVCGEAIDRVKLALEHAGMDMPEPIYRVQLTERGHGSALVVARTPAPAAASGTHPQPLVDTSAVTDLQEQIQDNPRDDRSANLLDPAGPKE